MEGVDRLHGGQQGTELLPDGLADVWWQGGHVVCSFVSGSLENSLNDRASVSAVRVGALPAYWCKLLFSRSVRSPYLESAESYMLISRDSQAHPQELSRFFQVDLRSSLEETAPFRTFLSIGLIRPGPRARRRDRACRRRSPSLCPPSGWARYGSKRWPAPPRHPRTSE